MNAEKVFKSVTREMDSDRIETSWISEYDAERIKDAREGYWDEFLNAYSEPRGVSITFPNKRCAVIWVAEIAGQISDGAWENYEFGPGESWQQLTCANLEVDEYYTDYAESEGHHAKLNYTEEMTSYEGLIGRIVFYVRAALGLEEYDVEDAKHDLALIEGINHGTQE